MTKPVSGSSPLCPTLPIQSSIKPNRNPRRALKVAVIGAGAAGLVTARELQREGHKVVVFERSDKIGGIWVYNPNVENDPLAVNPNRKIVHSSLYKSLRTNLPREIMGFLDYPFFVKEGRDSRRFPGHQEVLLYLNDFACHFDLLKLIRFETEVFYVGVLEDGKKWMVGSRRVFEEEEEHVLDVNEIYDGVVFCNGHYTEPRIAEIPGVDRWPGKQMHSHNYRSPEPFQDQIVVLIGSSASAFDISRDIPKLAKEVHVSSRSDSHGILTKLASCDNIWIHPSIERVHEDGTVVFQDRTSVLADIILHCTGYKYRFPFLQTNDIMTVDDNGVGPLYKHVFPPPLTPQLSFIGLPWKAVPFLLFELQSKWIAGILSGRISLPSQEMMMEDVKAFSSKLEAAGYDKNHRHNITDHQFEYDDWLATECGYPRVEEWRKQMLDVTLKNIVARPETFRDEWEDHHLVLEAEAHFLQFKKVQDAASYN